MIRMLAACFVGVLLIAPVRGSAAPVRVELLEGGEVDPFAAPAGTKAIVFLFTSVDCPVSNRFAPEVRRLAATFGPQGVLFRLIYPDPSEGAEAIRAHMAAFAYTEREGSGRAGRAKDATEAFRDPHHALVSFVGATITPEVAVVVGRHVAYRGRIDDRFVDLGLERPAPTRHDLADAIRSVLAGKPVVPATTQAVGCFISDFTR